VSLFFLSYRIKIIISNCSCNSAHLHPDDNDSLQNEQDVVSIKQKNPNRNKTTDHLL